MASLHCLPAKLCEKCSKAVCPAEFDIFWSGQLKLKASDPSLPIARPMIVLFAVCISLCRGRDLPQDQEKCQGVTRAAA